MVAADYVVLVIRCFAASGKRKKAEPNLLLVNRKNTNLGSI